MNKNTTQQEQITPGFKGFDKNFKCRDMQYAIGETHEANGKVKVCANGLHFCENPLDIFNYYSPADSRFAEVEGIGEAQKHCDDSKVAVSKLFVKAEITLHNLLNMGVKFILSKVNFTDAPATNTGNRSAATNTGDQSAATNTGNRSAATNTGYQSAATNTGNRSAATNTGDQSAATNTGYQSAATNTGDQSAATNTGNRSAATVEGEESVAVSLGIEGKAKGAKGCWIVLAEWVQDDQFNWSRVNVKSFKVDGKRVKADTFYQLREEKLVEAQ